MPNQKKCFVIMPFSETKPPHTTEYWTRHYISYLKPLIESVEGLETFRSEPLRGNIASQIITDLISADIVVADLTDHNPNVLWELGVRQSYKHCTITIAEVGTKIPFHFTMERWGNRLLVMLLHLQPLWEMGVRSVRTHDAYC
jgi:hypothetical protein